jgi:hypothetical protein
MAFTTTETTATAPTEARAPVFIPVEEDDPVFELHCALSRKRSREEDDQEEDHANAVVAAAAVEARKQQLYLRRSVAELKEMVAALEEEEHDDEQDEEQDEGSDCESESESEFDSEDEDEDEEDLDALEAMLQQATEHADVTDDMMNVWKRRKSDSGTVVVVGA